MSGGSARRPPSPQFPIEAIALDQQFLHESIAVRHLLTELGSLGLPGELLSGQFGFDPIAFGPCGLEDLESILEVSCEIIDALAKRIDLLPLACEFGLSRSQTPSEVVTFRLGTLSCPPCRFDARVATWHLGVRCGEPGPGLSAHCAGGGALRDQSS
jgi:hypothetical protein